MRAALQAPQTHNATSLAKRDRICSDGEPLLQHRARVDMMSGQNPFRLNLEKI